MIVGQHAHNYFGGALASVKMHYSYYSATLVAYRATFGFIIYFHRSLSLPVVLAGHLHMLDPA